MTTFQEITESKIGDQIVFDTPFGPSESYVFIGKVGKGYMFTDMKGASLSIHEQKTIDGFNVVKIDKDHESWSEHLYKHAVEFEKMMNEIFEGDPDGMSM